MDSTRPENEAAGWPFGGGEMARRVRAHDWSATLLGPIEQWPPCLRTTVQLVLVHPNPTMLLWGPDLIQVYNDGYRELMGVRQPMGLGLQTRECWPELWHINAPIYEQVRRGETLRVDSGLFRATGSDALQDARSMLSYSPVYDDTGTVAGVLLSVCEIASGQQAKTPPPKTGTDARHTVDLLEQLIESAADPIWTNDLDSRMVMLNSATARVLGRPRQALVGLRNSDVLPAAIVAQAESEDRRVLRDGQLIRVEQTVFDAGRGEPRVFSTIKTPLRSPDGHIVGMLGIARDITEHKRAEEALRASEELTRRVLQSSPDCVKVLSLDARMEFMSDGGLCALEVDDFDNQLRGTHWVSFWLPEDQPQVQAAIDTALAGDVGRFQAFCPTVKGTPRWWDVSITAIRDACSQPQKLLSISRDITDRKAAEDRLAEFNAILEQQVRQRTQELEALAARERAVVSSAATAIITMDLQGRVTSFNPAAEAMFRLAAQQALGESVVKMCDPHELRYKAHFFPQAVKDNAQQLPPQLQQGLHHHPEASVHAGAQRNEWTYWRSDGTSFPGLLSISVLRDEADQALGFLAVIADLTERRAMEEALRRRTAELELLRQRERAIVNSAGSAIIATDIAGHITAFNPSAEAMFAVPAAQVLGRYYMTLMDAQDVRSKTHLIPRVVQQHAEELPPDVRDRLGEPHDEPPREAVQPSEWLYVRADGTRFPGLLHVSLLRDEQGQVIGFLSVISDLSERKAMEEALLQRTDQAEAANRAKTAFLANMSHEIRTPLNAVIGLSQLLEHMALPVRALDYIGHIRQAGEQLLVLVNDVLDLSKIEAGEMRLEAVPFELGELLQQSRAMVEVAAAQKNLPLVVDLAPGVHQHLVGDPTRLKQVLVNLLGNAVKFTEEGSVTLRVAPLPSDVQEPVPQATLCFEVVDTGIGIPPEKQAAVFQSFTQADASTTRRFGGTGLGLSIVRHLVAMMGGRLELQSQPGQGSTFRVEITLATAT